MAGLSAGEADVTMAFDKGRLCHPDMGIVTCHQWHCEMLAVFSGYTTPSCVSSANRKLRPCELVIEEHLLSFSDQGLQ